MVVRPVSHKRYVPLSEFGREFRDLYKDNPYVDQTLREVLTGYVEEGIVNIEYDGVEGSRGMIEEASWHETCQIKMELDGKRRARFRIYYSDPGTLFSFRSGAFVSSDHAVESASNRGYRMELVYGTPEFEEDVHYIGVKSEN